MPTLKQVYEAHEYCNRVNPENDIQHQMYEKYEAIIKQFDDMLPIGSGICNTKVISVTDKKIVISFSYHHMNDNGYYEGYTDHECRITAKFDGFNIYISGRNKNDIKDYLHELFFYNITEFIN